MRIISQVEPRAWCQVPFAEKYRFTPESRNQSPTRWSWKKFDGYDHQENQQRLSREHGDTSWTWRWRMRSTPKRTFPKVTKFEKCTSDKKSRTGVISLSNLDLLLWSLDRAQLIMWLLTGAKVIPTTHGQVVIPRYRALQVTCQRLEAWHNIYGLGHQLASSRLWRLVHGYI